MPSPTANRILLVMNAFGWAGAETQLFHLATGLGEAGQDVTLLAIGSGDVDVQPLKDVGVKVVALGANSRLTKIRKMFVIAKYARRADVVHCTGWDATLWGRLAAVLAGRPMVITEHADPNRKLQVAKKGASRARIIALHNRILGHVTYVTVVVGACQIRQLESEGVRRESIVHIPNAVPVEVQRSRAELGPRRSDLGISEDALVVVQVARFWPEKGQMTTLRAISRLRERQLGDVRVVFVGDGPGEETVKREASEIGATWAIFLGKRDDVPGLLRLADLCVLPSTGEGLPMSLIESLVVGTPMVATDVGDIRWLLESSGGGICVAAGDEDGFADACARVLEDSDLRGRLGAAAAEAAKDFDAQKMTRRYEQVFDAAISSGPLPLVLAE